MMLQSLDSLILLRSQQYHCLVNLACCLMALNRPRHAKSLLEQVGLKRWIHWIGRMGYEGIRCKEMQRTQGLVSRVREVQITHVEILKASKCIDICEQEQRPMQRIAKTQKVTVLFTIFCNTFSLTSQPLEAAELQPSRASAQLNLVCCYLRILHRSAALQAIDQDPALRSKNYAEHGRTGKNMELHTHTDSFQNLNLELARIQSHYNPEIYIYI